NEVPDMAALYGRVRRSISERQHRCAPGSSKPARQVEELHAADAGELVHERGGKARGTRLDIARGVQALHSSSTIRSGTNAPSARPEAGSHSRFRIAVPALVCNDRPAPPFS